MDRRTALLIIAGVMAVSAFGCRTVPATASIDAPEPPATVQIRRESNSQLPAGKERKANTRPQASIEQAKSEGVSESPNRLTRWLTPRSKSSKSVGKQKRIPLPLEEESETPEAEEKRSLDDF